MDATRAAPFPLSVLVVDDDRDTAESLAELLSLKGFSARCACSGDDALAEVEIASPDVVILDIVMPGMNGWELARRLDAMWKPPLMVVVSASVEPGDRERSNSLGISLHLTKPADTQQLLTVLGRFNRVVGPLGEPDA